MRYAYGASTTPTIALPTNHPWVAIASGLRPDPPYDHRTPSPMSATSRRTVIPVRAGGSSIRILRKVIAE